MKLKNVRAFSQTAIFLTSTGKAIGADLNYLSST